MKEPIKILLISAVILLGAGIIHNAMQKANVETFLYFAYGSNLLTKRIHHQNPSAVSKGPALLKDYQLEFRYPSKVNDF